jgi:hypothetical protein
MPREPLKPIEPSPAKEPSRQYTLRKGFSMQMGREMIHGPEIVNLTLKQAYDYKHMLAEFHDIEKEWAERRSAEGKAQADLAMSAARSRAGVSASG